MDDIQEIKKVLKKWELKFVQEHKRKPTKTDIASASDDIKDAYSQYSSLKKQNQSVLNETVDVWSDSLNRSTKQTQKDDTEKKNPVSSNYLEKLGAKLFQNSKSLGHSPKNPLKKLPSKNYIENSSASNENCEEMSKSPVKSQSADKSLFEKALLLTQSKGVKSVTNDFDESHIPQPFKQQQRSALMHKKYQRLSSFNHEGTEIGDTSLYSNEDGEKSSQKDVVWKNEELDIKDECSPMKVTEEKKSDLLKIDHKNSSLMSKSHLVPHSLLDFDPTSQEPEFNFQDELEVEMELTNTRYKNKPKEENITGQKTRTSKKRRKVIDDDSDEDNTDDVQVNKRSKMEANDSPGKDQPEESTDVDDSERIKPTPIRKVASSKPMKTDNFVRLNMRTKTYKRKGKGMTGGQHKRLLWKNKMAARSKSRGDTCFKCGETGHWASKCPNKGNSKKQPHKMNFGPTKKAKSTETQQEDEEEEEVTFDLDMDMVMDMDSGVIPTAYDAPVAPQPMEPLVCPNEDGSLPDMDDLVYDALKKFGFDSFRNGQEKSVKRILCGLSTLVVLSTGAGKSLCYQLPAYLYAQRSKCITLVISPLVSLMEDQIARLPNGVMGACFHSNMTKVQREKVLTALSDGILHLLLISPETIAGGGGGFSHGNHINPAKLPPVAFVCIDEAHCLSEWSHHFRPSYLRLCKVLRDKFGVKCFLGLTATATLSTAADVSRHLNISNFEEATIRGQPVPDNLKMSVSRDEDRDDALIHLLQGERMSKCASIIIYCTRRDQTDRLATLIRTCLKDSMLDKDIIQEYAAENKKQVKAKSKVKRKVNNLTWDAESYHAGLSASQRRSVQNAFMSGRLRVVVATVAFGMGLDKSDVRAVIHYNMPKSFESYVQEIGRAGRDGKPAHCHVFLDQQGKDLSELRKHTFANTIDRFTIKKLLQKVFHKCRCAEIQERTKKAAQDCEFPEDGIDYSEVVEVKASGPTQSQKVKNLSEDSFSVENPNTEAVQKLLVDRSGSDGNIPDRASGVRICPGHERAIPIEPTVMELDVKEEGLATLLCYLELRPDGIMENLPPVYATCKLQCYGGPAQLQQVAKKCPPVSVAIARLKRDGGFDKTMKELEFNVTEVADSMGWNSGPVKRELKQLQWNISGTGAASKSGVMVELTDLAFHVRAPGDMSDDERDTILEELNQRVQRQEKTELRQLQQLHTALTSVSHKAYWMCSDQVDEKRDKKLKSIVDNYFENQTSQEEQNRQELETPEVDSNTLCQLQSDVRAFINMYSTDHVINARVIARIFQGIPSPCFPAIVWGRVRRYWRCYLHVDFNIVMNAARKCLIQMRT